MKKNLSLFCLLITVAMQCRAITVEPPLPKVDAERMADSAFAAMSIDERIMQLYIYAPESSNNYILQSGPVPSGVLLPVSTFATMKKQIDALGSWGDTPGWVAIDMDSPIPATPNYMNPYNVIASRHDSLVESIVANAIVDSLQTIGVNMTTGLLANGYGELNDKPNTRRIVPLGFHDATAISAFRLTLFTSVKAALESDNVCIIGSTTPEMFLIRAQKVIKDNPDIANIIDYKAHQMLQLKYIINNNFPKSGNHINKVEASTICAMKSITCISNENQMLPLPSDASMEIIQIGGLPLAAFSTQASTMANCTYQYADTSMQAVSSALAKRHQNSKSIVLLNAPIAHQATAKIISKAASDGKTCIVNFDNPSNLAMIDGKCILQQIGNNVTAAQMAAMAVCGTIDIQGAFPYPSAGKAKHGEGIRIDANKLKYTILRETGFNMCYKDTLDSIISAAIRYNAFPGCQVFAAKDGKVIINQAYGHFTYDNDQRAVNTNDLYDLASLTKVTATTLMAMHLYEQKKMDIEKPLGTYLHYDDAAYKPVMSVRIKAILQHRSGIYAHTPITRFGNNALGWRRLGKSIGLATDTMPLQSLAEAAYNELYSPTYLKDSASIRVSDSLWLRNNYLDSLKKFYTHLSVKKRKRYKYSDVNMILLQWAEEEVLQCRADSFLHRTFYKPLGMTRTCYTPLLHNIPANQIAPTAEQQWTKKMLQGDVHDPAAALLGGVAGNAGLFSTAQNVGILFQMLLNGGEYGGKRYFDKKTIEKFTAKQPNTRRALGFDMVPNNFSAKTAGERTYGHTGFTGTCAWADPDNNIVIVFTCNRIYPDVNNKTINTQKIRQKICQAIYDGLGLKQEERVEM
ncbi:MAG: serine hydrolase [Bacteroidales bacterium]|nr:serine hydrolase [Bacteroidales bacterium]